MAGGSIEMSLGTSLARTTFKQRAPRIPDMAETIGGMSGTACVSAFPVNDHRCM